MEYEQLDNLLRGCFQNKKADENSKIWWKVFGNGEDNTVLILLRGKLNKKRKLL
jgi:hypothetical protein